MTESLIWLVSALIGLVFCARNVRRALHARRAAQEERPDYVPDAESRVRLDLVRILFCCGPSAVAGLLSLLAMTGVIEPQRSFVILLIILGNFGVTLNSALDDWDASHPRRRP